MATFVNRRIRFGHKLVEFVFEGETFEATIDPPRPQRLDDPGSEAEVISIDDGEGVTLKTWSSEMEDAAINAYYEAMERAYVGED